MTDTPPKPTRRGRPPKTSLQDQMEAATNAITLELGKFVTIFEDVNAGKIRDVERIATFSYLAKHLDKIAKRCANSHENARLTSGVFSLKDAADNYREPQAPFQAAPAPTPSFGVITQEMPRPEGFIPLELRDPGLAYDSYTGRAIGRKPKSLRVDPLADPEAGFIQDKSGD